MKTSDGLYYKKPDRDPDMVMSHCAFWLEESLLLLDTRAKYNDNLIRKIVITDESITHVRFSNSNRVDEIIFYDLRRDIASRIIELIIMRDIEDVLLSETEE